MDDILKSEIFIVVYGKKDGVSFEEFGGLFRQVHGYNLNLLNYGYRSLRSLLQDMKELVEIKFVNGQHIIKCKLPSKHHVVVSEGNNSLQANEQVSGLSEFLPSCGPSPGPVGKKAEQTQPAHPKQNYVKVNSTNAATGKMSKKTPNPSSSTPAKKTDPKVNNTNFATGKMSKRPPKSTCPTPAKPTGPKVSHIKSPQPIKGGLSLNKVAVTINKTNNNHGLSASPKPPMSKPQHASPAGNVAAAAAATRTNNLSISRQESHPRSSNPASSTNLKPFQGNRPASTRVVETKPFSATSGPARKPGLLPIPQTLLNSNVFDSNYMPQVTQSAILSNMSYASALTSNMSRSHFNHNEPQYAPNNTRFNLGTSVYSTNVTHPHSRTEGRTPIQPNSVIKENIKELLTQHNNGLSIFQLQKMYLFMFEQPLKFRGSATLKQLLMELKDVVKTEGVGVQMVVSPVSVENSQTTAANGDHDAVLHIAGSRQLSPHDDQILASRQHEMDPAEEHITQVVNTENYQPTLQSMQKAKETSFNLHQEEFPRLELSVPAPDVIPNQIHKKTQYKLPQSVQMHRQMNKSHGQEEMTSVCKNVIMKDAATTNGPSQIALQDLNSHRVILHSSGFSFVMGQPIDGPNNKASSVSEQDTPYDSNNMLEVPEHLLQILPNAQSSMLLLDTKPHEFSRFRVENPERLRLQPDNTKKTMKTDERTKSPTLHQTANNCDFPENTSHCRDSFQTKTVPVQTLTPSSAQPKNNSQIRNNVEQTVSSSPNKQGLDTQSQNTNNMSVLLNASSNEKAPDAQTKNVTKKTTQEEESVSPHTNDQDKANAQDIYVHGTEKATHMSPGVHEDSKAKQHKFIVQTKQFDEFNTPEMIPQNGFLTSRQEIVGPIQDVPKQPKTSVAQSRLQNHLDSPTQQKASVSPQTNDQDKANDVYVHGTEQATHMSPGVHEALNTQASKGKNNKSTLQTKQCDEFPTPKMVAQNGLLTSRQEIVSPIQDMLKQSQITVAQSELQNNLDIITPQKASVFPPTNGQDKANGYDVYVHGTEQVLNTQVNKGKQHKSTPEMVAQNGLLSTRQLVDPIQDMPKQSQISGVQSELQNNLDSTTQQEDMNKTWQTSQEQACRIL
ncbi:uncharacterized protein [Dendropsophus ebraccatus]|uniref:uncharacterized protein isoform X2 n=1 Tax=Dendropsophus ebraccatus TaxID=150705 RepID=UPI0038313AA4